MKEIDAHWDWGLSRSYLLLGNISNILGEREIYEGIIPP
jgi:hypothetical protein